MTPLVTISLICQQLLTILRLQGCPHGHSFLMSFFLKIFDLSYPVLQDQRESHPQDQCVHGGGELVCFLSDWGPLFGGVKVFRIRVEFKFVWVWFIERSAGCQKVHRPQRRDVLCLWHHKLRPSCGGLKKGQLEIWEIEQRARCLPYTQITWV